MSANGEAVRPKTEGATMFYRFTNAKRNSARLLSHAIVPLRMSAMFVGVRGCVRAASDTAQIAGPVNQNIEALRSGAQLSEVIWDR